MLSRIREQIGTAGLIVAIVALVAALGGGAYAAKGGLKLNPKQKKEVRAIAKKEAERFAKRGPKGAKGDPGAPGAKGDPGAPGANGSNGANGKDGKSVTVTAEPEGSNCPDGGVAVEVEGSGNPAYACNGTTGFTATLPSGQTETGTWGGNYVEGDLAVEAINFNIPLASAPEPVFVGYSQADKEQGEAEGCPGLLGDGTPTAEPGKLCIYYTFNFQEKVELEAINFVRLASGDVGADPSGTGMMVACTTEENKYPCIGGGVWAVTAP